MLVRACATIAATAVALGMSVAVPTTSGAEPQYEEYVALGDSWSADVTLVNVDTAHTPFGCAQSRSDYPKLVAAALAVPTFRDATCGSATTADLTVPQPLYVPELLGTNPPQFDRLTPTTDLVTLGIGGNDSELAKVVESCIGPSCVDQWVVDGVDRMSQNIAATEPKISVAIEGIRARSPHARILLVGYLAGISPVTGCVAQSMIANSDSEWVGRKLIELNEMIERAASNAGVEYVDTYSGSVGHDMCQAPGVRWVEGTLPISSTPQGLAIPFHPNQLGADHQARTVAAVLGR